MQNEREKNEYKYLSANHKLLADNFLKNRTKGASL